MYWVIMYNIFLLVDYGPKSLKNSRLGDLVGFLLHSCNKCNYSNNPFSKCRGILKKKIS